MTEMSASESDPTTLAAKWRPSGNLTPVLSAFAVTVELGREKPPAAATQAAIGTHVCGGPRISLIPCHKRRASDTGHENDSGPARPARRECDRVKELAAALLCATWALTARRAEAGLADVIAATAQ